MYAVEEPENVESREFYRCQIDSESSRATIKVGRKKLAAAVLEKSISNFTVVLKKKAAAKLREGSVAQLTFDGAIFKVFVERVSKAKEGYVQIALQQLEDLTPPEPIRSSWWPSRRPVDEGTATIAFAGIVMVLFCAMSMPGLGDRLGTSNYIQNGFQWFVDGAKELSN